DPGSWNEDHCEFFSNAATGGAECQLENSVSSNCIPAFDLGLRNSEPLPPIQKQINTKEKRQPPIQCTDTLRQKNEGDCHFQSINEPVWIADCSKYLSPSRSFRLLSTSSDNAENLGVHWPQSLSQNKGSHSSSPPAIEEQGELEGNKLCAHPVIYPVSQYRQMKMENRFPDLEDSKRRHDAPTKAVLSVVFPPSNYSTHGLSRPGTPAKGHTA
ncbi:hypothetical protein XELAEV_180174175mg, partial [Xenopus laevis]